jgi:NAD(P)H-hydrate repair Nnr-like enzyme with NAD(P)H-hydrate dehydratase domain
VAVATIRAVLPQLLAQAPQLVLDADALNATAEDPQPMALVQ